MPDMLVRTVAKSYILCVEILEMPRTDSYRQPEADMEWRNNFPNTVIPKTQLLGHFLKSLNIFGVFKIDLKIDLFGFHALSKLFFSSHHKRKLYISLDAFVFLKMMVSIHVGFSLRLLLLPDVKDMR